MGCTLLYSQVDKDFKDEPIGHEAKFKNAKLSLYREFEWAKPSWISLSSHIKAYCQRCNGFIVADQRQFRFDSTYEALAIYARPILRIQE